MSIKFEKNKGLLILSYTATDLRWLVYKLSNDGEGTIQQTFTFERSSLYEPSNLELENKEFNTLKFILAEKSGNYFKIKNKILRIDNLLYIHEDIELSERFFISAKNISIFGRVSNLVQGDIYIGGNNNNHVPEKEFLKLIKNFPNTYEQKKYADAIVSSMLKNYFDIFVDAESAYHKYTNKKQRIIGADISQVLKSQEIHKYKIILDKLEAMLSNENSYTEKQWQNEIIQIVLLIFPKYIQAFSEAPVRDTYSKKNRSLDFMLVDSSGSIDLIEIKKPFENSIMTKGKYRDNHIPLRDLSGTIMQIEKYIFYLNKWGKKGEKKLTEKYKDELPENFTINITNPSAIVIMGRDNNLSPNQMHDFEIVKRKYKNVVDIITYDNLISRLRFTIEQWEKTKNT